MGRCCPESDPSPCPRLPASLDPLRREVFQARLDALVARPAEAARAVYPDPDEPWPAGLVDLAAAAYAAATDDLHAPRPAAVARARLVPATRRCSGYAAYADRFAGDLRGVADHVDYLRELGVTYLHLMPLLQPAAGAQRRRLRRRRLPRGPRRTSAPSTTCATLAAVLRERRHQPLPRPRAQPRRPRARVGRRARAGDPRYRGYFHVFPDRTVPDAYERTLPEVFPRLRARQLHLGRRPATAGSGRRSTPTSGTSTGRTPTCSASTPTSCCTSPTSGVEVLRLDAIAFIWKRMGTDCQNQPEVHAITQALRTVARIACPAVLFKAEAIVGPRDLPAYLGRGEHDGKVSDLAYHNSLMVQVWSMLASRDVRPGGVRARSSCRRRPPTTAWITYVRCHDDIGWAIDDGDAAAVGRQRLRAPAVPLRLLHRGVPGLVGARAGVPGEPGHRRPAHLRDRWRRLAGRRVPATRSRVDADPCWRTRSCWASAACRCSGWATSSGCSTTTTGPPSPATRTTTGGCTGRGCPGRGRPRRTPSVSGRGSGRCSRLARTCRTCTRRCRRRCSTPRDPGVLLVLRRHPLGPMLGAYNVTDRPGEVPTSLLHDLGLGDHPLDHVSGATLPLDGAPTLRLPPYTPLWLTHVSPPLVLSSREGRAGLSRRTATRARANRH